MLISEFEPCMQPLIWVPKHENKCMKHEIVWPKSIQYFKHTDVNAHNMEMVDNCMKLAGKTYKTPPKSYKRNLDYFQDGRHNLLMAVNRGKFNIDVIFKRI